MSKKHNITLTNGAANVLSQLGSIPGLITEPNILFRFGEFNENHLSNIETPPDISNPPTKEELAVQKSWANTTWTGLEIGEKTREALKAVVTTAITKGILPSGKPVMVLMRELGIAPESE